MPVADDEKLNNDVAEPASITVTQDEQAVGSTEDDFSDGYKFKLDYFDGPLDLLLHLIKENKLDIKVVALAQITGQYLEYMEQINSVNLDLATQFIEVAATLIEIKSRAMLPKIEEMMPDNVDGEDPAERLLDRMREYQLFKEMAAKIKEFENVNSFYRAPDPSVNDYKIVLKQMTLDGLLDAFSRLLTKVEKAKLPPPSKRINKDPFTVAEKIIHIRNSAKLRGQLSFYELFEDERTRSEIITTFMALLELLKLQVIRAEQNGTYEDITIVFVGE